MSMGASMFETLVMDHFRSRGFPVVDAATVQSILEADQLKLILEGDDRTAALLGLQAGAEIVVSGTAMHRARITWWQAPEGRFTSTGSAPGR